MSMGNRVSDWNPVPLGGSTDKGVNSLSARDWKVLAALARRPFGFPTIADVARAAEIPPTTTGRILRCLLDADMVRLDIRGSVGKEEGRVWILNFCPRVVRVLPAFSRGAPPDGEGDRLPSARNVPHRFWRHFWNTNPRKLVLPDDAHKVAERLIRSKDPAAFGWALVNLPIGSLSRLARSRRVDAQTRSIIREGLSLRARANRSA